MADILSFLQTPVPLYLLSVLPAIFIAGEAPFRSLPSKIWHTLVCLGCPFTPLFYYIHIPSGQENENFLDKCCYWLPAEKFEYRDDEGRIIHMWPFAHERKSLDINPNIK